MKQKSDPLAVPVPLRMSDNKSQKVEQNRVIQVPTHSPSKVPRPVNHLKVGNPSILELGRGKEPREPGTQNKDVRVDRDGLALRPLVPKVVEPVLELFRLADGDVLLLEALTETAVALGEVLGLELETRKSQTGLGTLLQPLQKQPTATGSKSNSQSLSSVT
jgi:hypothetical protein